MTVLPGHEATMAMLNPGIIAATDSRGSLVLRGSPTDRSGGAVEQGDAPRLFQPHDIAEGLSSTLRSTANATPRFRPTRELRAPKVKDFTALRGVCEFAPAWRALKTRSPFFSDEGPCDRAGTTCFSSQDAKRLSQ
jgi:hypothetical protein